MPIGSKSPPTAMSSSQLRTTQGREGHDAACACAACIGLRSLVRPRFFAGQLLTDIDLMELERYTVTTHRLHNRYLHGWGVVCGLDVLCDDCGDGVMVKPGYALDPCGRDVIVPETQRVDVMKLIRACVEAERVAPVCDPPMPRTPPGCDDDDHWCVTLRYRERPMRPVTPLAGSTKKAGCGCGCGTGGRQSAGCGCSSHGSNCGCGCGGAAVPAAGYACSCGEGGSRSTQACGCAPYVAAPDLPPGCEPTRVLECFEIGVCRDNGSCRDLEHALGGTMILRIVECLKTLQPIFTKRLSSNQQKLAARAVLGETRGNDAADTRIALCELYETVLDLYRRDPLRTTCQVPAELLSIDCSAQRETESNESYVQRLQEVARMLTTLVLAYVRDCICRAINPPCPDGACDDRIVLGCFTVSGDKVVGICSFDCRKYAGSFNSLAYWLPVGPVAGWLIGMLCCFPLFARAGGRDKLQMMRMFQTADPTGNLRRLVMDDDFSIVRTLRTRITQAFRTTSAPWMQRLHPSDDAVNLSRYEGERAETVSDALAGAGIVVVLEEVDDPDKLPATFAAFPVVEPGAVVRQFVHRGRVVGFAPGEDQGVATAWDEDI